MTTEEQAWVGTRWIWGKYRNTLAMQEGIKYTINASSGYCAHTLGTTRRSDVSNRALTSQCTGKTKIRKREK